MADLTVDVPPFVCFVARVRAQENKDPIYGEWRRETRLQCLDIFGASSLASHSYAKVQLVTGDTGKKGDYTLDVEYAESVLWYGDRIAIGLERTPDNIDWLFCGYILSVNLDIDVPAERRVYKAVGPEWVWGGKDAGSGANFVVSGQARRLSGPDDAWQKAPTTKTRYPEWGIFGDETAVFNPKGRKNCTRDDVILTPKKAVKRIEGKLWESPDRRVNETDVAIAWDMRNACKSIVHIFGELQFAGIAPPDWNDVPMSILDKMRETNVEGVGVWEALRRICGSKYAFYVECFPRNDKGRPVPVRGKSWGPFRLRFYKRTTGDEADFWLNRKGTTMAAAQASVKRLASVRDISNTVNRVVVRGTYMRALRLIYWGAATPTIDATKRKAALQNGWNTTEENIATYASGPDKEVTPLFHPDAAKRLNWLKRYVTTGPEFQKYWHVFRRFIWNEAGEADTTKKAKYLNTDLNYYAPNLDGIADNPDFPRAWYRHRRKLLDTLYLRNAAISSWEKHRPTLFMAAAATATAENFTDWKWRRIADSHFRFDAERAALTFTAEDIGEWKPFHKQDSGEVDEVQSWPDDERSFGTLLASGKLRLCVECSIVCDGSLEGIADRRNLSGSPFVREVVVPGQNNFIVSMPYVDGFAPPSGMIPTPIDQRADAQRHANITRESSEDEQIHASIVAAGDWPKQAIGTQVRTLKGRGIDMTTQGGRGAQIVAYRIDPANLHYEYLTETVALAILRQERKLKDKAQLFNAKRATSIPNG